MKAKLIVEFIVDAEPGLFLTMQDVSNAMMNYGYEVDPITSHNDGKLIGFHVKYKKLFTDQEEKEIKEFLDNNKELMQDLAEAGD